MLTVPVDVVVVESMLLSGALSCPCAGVLGPWGHARERPVVDGVLVRVRPRRARCRACRATHVLLPASLLLRRAHGVAVIGAALQFFAAGISRRGVARELGLPRSTVRGWLDRLASLAGRLRAHFTAWLLWLAPSRARASPATQTDPVAAVVGLVLAVGAEAVGRLGAADVWRFAAAATGGRLLATRARQFPSPWIG